MDPTIEARLIEDHPDQLSDRGRVIFWNFLPPGELNRLLSLYNTVTRKTLLISDTMEIEGRKLLTPEDKFEALREFNAGYEGERSLLENLQLELQDLLKDIPNLKERLDDFPGSIFSCRVVSKKGTTGVFFCYRLPAWNVDLENFATEQGSCQWYLYEMQNGNVLQEISEIISSVKCLVEEPRKCVNTQETLIEIREKVRKHIKNSYLKKVEAPIIAKPKLLAWMEIN